MSARLLIVPCIVLAAFLTSRADGPFVGNRGNAAVRLRGTVPNALPLSGGRVMPLKRRPTRSRRVEQAETEKPPVEPAPTIERPEREVVVRPVSVPLRSVEIARRSSPPEAPPAVQPRRPPVVESPPLAPVLVGGTPSRTNDDVVPIPSVDPRPARPEAPATPPVVPVEAVHPFVPERVRSVAPIRRTELPRTQPVDPIEPEPEPEPEVAGPEEPTVPTIDPEEFAAEDVEDSIRPRNRLLRDTRVGDVRATLDDPIGGLTPNDYTDEIGLGEPIVDNPGGTFAWANDVPGPRNYVFCHEPLYFEDANLERMGCRRHAWIQPISSAALFFGTIPILPYKMGVAGPTKCVPATKFLGPCQRYPWHVNSLPPPSWRGAAVQAAAVTGVIFVVP